MSTYLLVRRATQSEELLGGINFSSWTFFWVSKQKKPKALNSIVVNENTKWNNSTMQKFFMKYYKTATTVQSMQIIHLGSCV